MLTSTYSPHREGSGMMQLHSPTHSPHLESPSASAIREIRRNLSRSPSKAPFNFRSTPIMYAPSPLSPSKRSTSENILHFGSMVSPYGTRSTQTGRTQRPHLKRTANTIATSRTRTSPRSPTKRVLSDSSDTNMRSPMIRKRRSTELDDDIEISLEDNKENTLLHDEDNSMIWKPTPAAKQEKRKSIGLHVEASPLSPLKRSETTMNVDQPIFGSLSAKRRSIQAPAHLDFSIFDSDNLKDDEKRSQDDHDWFRSIPLSPSGRFSTIPKRSSSLRKSTLQQRQMQGASPLRSHFPQHWIDATPSTKKTLRTSLDMPPPQRESPFSAQGHLLNASIHPMPPPRDSASQTMQGKHPLARTMTQSSNTTQGSMDHSPTHEPTRRANQSRPNYFSKSLPAGTSRPTEAEQSTLTDFSSQNSWATPATFKAAKPLPAAFMSTGLISKKNRNLDAPDVGAPKAHMPDTPCKKALVFDPKAVAKPAPSAVTNLRASLAAPKSPCESPFGVSRTTPFPWAKSSSLFPIKARQSLTRKASFASFASIEVDDKPASRSTSVVGDSQSTDSDLPPTPTKHTLAHDTRAGSISPSPQNVLSQSQAFPGSSQPLRFINLTPFSSQIQESGPRTPLENVFPPDPSSLSISGRTDRPTTRQSNEQFSPFVPATPTGPREYFGNFSNRPSLNLNAPEITDVDASLTSRFDRIDLVGTGEFSQVYKVTQKAQISPFAKSVSASRSSSRNSTPERVWAVKKSRHPYSGPKDRARKVHEVDVLKALGQNDHIVHFVDSWEDRGHLYIQTEFCEEGTLDVFLAQVGMKARLDDFRIWKILLELSRGLRHIHHTGFIHLDIKPANVLVTFEGVLKIADFGMATKWPAKAGIDGEGDREYIGPEVLMGKYDKPADIFALGLIMFETAGNVELPDNGQSWQKLRNGDMSDVPSLTWSSADSNILRDSQGNPLEDDEPPDNAEVTFAEDDGMLQESQAAKVSCMIRRGELVTPPDFMVDAGSDQALDRLVQWMIQPNPNDRPAVDDILAAHGVQWVESRRRAGATIFEGVWGPADEILAEDAEMIDV